ncbi:hypothetical protein EDB84DRAFT_1447252 [Lactarius hengduanensis]|nr:hypothetical protein EDB84DRAFT_1447252 [Lactarius hengduanensis]
MAGTTFCLELGVDSVIMRRRWRGCVMDPAQHLSNTPGQQRMPVGYPLPPPHAAAPHPGYLPHGPMPYPPIANGFGPQYQPWPPSTTDRFAPKYEDRDTTFRRLSDEMASFFVGPMPPHDFLDTFLPSTLAQPRSSIRTGNVFSSEMYDTFVEIVGSRLPKLTLVNTSRKNDKAPYTRFTFSSAAITTTSSTRLLSSFPVEFKTTTDQDPFVADLPMLPGNKGLVIENPFMSTSYSGRLVAGQITAYATLVLSAQYRTTHVPRSHLQNYARLIRWDRSGAVVTAPIYYDNEPHLLDFSSATTTQTLKPAATILPLAHPPRTKSEMPNSQ